MTFDDSQNPQLQWTVTETLTVTEKVTETLTVIAKETEPLI